MFCEEQRIFAGDDRDEIDAAALPIVALSSLGVAADMVVGTVRIHEAERGLWWGSRLAVIPSCRNVGAIGTSLIQWAVGGARARGCERFLTHVQSQNVALFERLHWRSLDQMSCHGRPHHLMQADLSRYAPLDDASRPLIALLKRAA